MVCYYFWDMDHTLINNDCDVSWKYFMVELGLAPQKDLEEAERFYADYQNGTLDFQQFLAFQLKEFQGRTKEEMKQLSHQHFLAKVYNRFYLEAVECIQQQRGEGSKVCLLTATNRVIAEPIAYAIGIQEIIATELEIIEGYYTGRLSGIYCGGEGKLQRLQLYCREKGIHPEECVYFGDSINDQFVLKWVGKPYAVNPGPALLQLARQYQWEVLTFQTVGEVGS